MQVLNYTQFKNFYSREPFCYFWNIRKIDVGEKKVRGFQICQPANMLCSLSLKHCNVIYRGNL